MQRIAARRRWSSTRPEEIRRSARTLIKYGVDDLKIHLSGEFIVGIPVEQSPFSEALRSATKLGGEIMQRQHELGMLKPGHLADIVLVEGDPLKNLALLTDPARIQLVIKDGVVHKDCATPVPQEAVLHLAGADRPLKEDGVVPAAVPVVVPSVVPADGRQ